MYTQPVYRVICHNRHVNLPSLGDIESLLKEILENETPASAPTVPQELQEASCTIGDGQDGCKCGDNDCDISDDGSDSDGMLYL